MKEPEKQEESKPDFELSEKIAQIIRDNNTFSGQVGDYVIHGAISEIIKLTQSQLSSLKKENEVINELYSAVCNELEKVKKELDETRQAWKKDRDNLQVERLRVEKANIDLKKENDDLEKMYRNLNEYNDKTCGDLQKENEELKAYIENLQKGYDH